MDNLKLDVLKEPRGFIRVLQFVCLLKFKNKSLTYMVITLASAVIGLCDLRLRHDNQLW